MSSKSSCYVCQNCGYITSQFFGKCRNCKSWNSIIEEKKSSKSKHIIENSTNKPRSLEEIKIQKISRIKSGFKEFDRVLGGGFVYGSFALLGGEPGIGKSTLVLQAASKISMSKKVLYISAEESLEQVKIRWNRLDETSENLKIFSENNLAVIIQEIKNAKPSLAIIDSIQAINNLEMESSSGSVSQVRSCSNDLQHLAKEYGITILIIGHVTKEGSLAGPKTLEHLVDVVLNFEGDQIGSHRILRSIKNRFGATLEIGIFDMQENGLQEVLNTSANFTNNENFAGLATTITREGTRCFAVDIQALVNKSFYNNPRRTTTGIQLNRLHQILAVIEKSLGFKLAQYDCYIATAGGFDINDPSSDLGITISLISSHKNIKPLRDCAFIGEIGLNGQVRKTIYMEQRIEESIRLGFKNIMVPKTDNDSKKKYQNIKILEVQNISEAFNRGLENN